MAEAHVRPATENDATDGFGILGGLHETNNQRTLRLDIWPEGRTYKLRIQTDDAELQTLFGDPQEHELPITESELLGAVQSCRSTWNERLVHLAQGPMKPFQQFWDFKDHGDLMEQALPELARAGAMLFLTLFYPRAAEDPQLHAGLRKVGKGLRQAMAARNRWLKIASTDFHVPWGLIYSEPLDIDGKNWRPEGFWGYQHLIDSAPLGKGGMKNDLEVPDGDPLVMALQLDSGIDQQLKVPCIQLVEDQLAKYGNALRIDRRIRRTALAQALGQGPLDEHVLFFCCHAIVDGVSTEIRSDEAYLTLSDRSPDPKLDRITPDDILQWIDMRSFYEDGRRPIFFLNACGSGQLNSIFYPSFGERFLELGASSVVGAQVELPAFFAGEFARRFFERFFTGGTENQIGKILFDLRRAFFNDHKNPLGLIYSLYRGADIYLRRGLSPPGVP
jgi:hypothetical protein